jgi:hypothetical protein
MVTTGWWTARRRERSTGTFDVVGLMFVSFVGLGSIGYGLQVVAGTIVPLVRMPVPMYFVFGAVALLFALSDLRMLMRGGYAGTQRLVRHLSRMGIALLFATLSFYPGQAKLFPKAIRATNLLFIPHVLLAGAIVYSLVRMRSRRRAMAIAATDAIADTTREEPAVIALAS